MASQMVVAPSKDTLFVRGFSARRDVEDVRDFFEKEARSKVTIEFLKQTELDERLFVALRFESKDIARDILSRYDNTEVLGDKIALSWFKDLRRARGVRPYGQMFHRDNRFQNRRYDSYNDYKNYSHGYGGRNHRDNRGDKYDSRRRRSSHRYDRSHSRSASRSRSRSHSRDSREKERRDDTRSRSRSPKDKHKLKSAVTTASKDHRGDDSDHSSVKDSSQSPERRRQYESDSDMEEDEYSLRGNSKAKDKINKSKDTTQEGDFLDDESFEEKYLDEKYQQDSGRSRKESRRDSESEKERYTPFYDNKTEIEWANSTGTNWSQKAMGLIQDKKQDIEKVYKNDCEVFVSVVKMLISKDPELESSLQHSLRENLKEIGQRCIIELREFIDKVREKEEASNASANQISAGGGANI